jgi:hypothetical protein
MRIVLWLLVTLWLLSGGVYAQTFGPEPLPKDADIIWSVIPTELTTAPSLDGLPWEVLSAIAAESVGIDPSKSSKVVGGVSFGDRGLKEVGVWFYPSRNADMAYLKTPTFGPMRSTTAAPNLRARNLSGTHYSFVQRESTWLFGSANALKEMLDAESGGHRLEGALRQSGSSCRVIVDAKALQGKVQKIWEASLNARERELVAQLEILLTKVDHIEINLQFQSQASVEVCFSGVQGEAAEEYLPAVNQFLDAIAAWGISKFRAGLNDISVPPITKYSWQAFVERLSTSVRVLSTAEVREGAVVVRLSNLETLVTLATMVVASPHFMVELNRFVPRPKTEWNLEQIALAIHNYETVHRRLPPRTIVDKGGTSMLSWRVALLPYLGESDLYSQFHLEEPWDSDHNKALLEEMPAVFANPNANLAVGYTSYVAPHGMQDRKLQTVWDSGPLLLRQVSDGLANTLAVVEVQPTAAVPWTKPEDFDLRERSLDEFLGAPPAGGYAVMLDMSTYDISQWKDSAKLKAVLSVQGGEPVTAPF